MNTRLIFASNAGLEMLSDPSVFRRDLFFRIEGNVVELPPLRDRDDDILLLMSYFFTNFSPQYSVTDQLDLPALKEQLLSYNWPGNIRELRNFCKFIMINEPKINNGIILKHLRQRNTYFQNISEGGLDRYLKIDNLKDSVAEFEREYLLYHLKQNGWHISQTAKAIGIERTTLYKKIKNLGISSMIVED